MKKRTRFIILIICVLAFFIFTPILVAYSIGYRFDFEKMRITSTGGIYVRTYPAPEQVIIDSKIIEKPGIFSSATFTQSLLPANHTILAQKAGYYDYFKTIPVLEKEVTKLENIILFKKNIEFEMVENTVESPFADNERFVLKNSNLYYSNILKNVGISEAQKLIPVIKKISAFSIQNNNIIWLGTDGFLYKSNLSDLSAEPIKLVLNPIKILKTGTYKIITDNNNIFVNDNGSLLTLNSQTNELEDFYSPATDIKISPDGKNIIYYNENNIYVSPLPIILTVESNLLYATPAKITNIVWLNNNYIIFADENNIIISEIDYRGNINTVTLPQAVIVTKIPTSDAQKSATTTQVSSVSEPQEIEINIKNPQIYFDQQTNKLYILTGENLLLSEKIIP